MRTASATLGGTKTAITVSSMDAAQFGALVTRTITSSSPSAGTIPLVTPGGTVTIAYGGSNFSSDTSAYAGQTGVTELDISITKTTDSKLTTAGGGTILSFTNPVGLQYSGFGVWSLTTCGNNSTTGCLPLYAGSFAGEQSTGSATTTASMPRTGLATFTGGAVGYVVQSAASNVAGNNVGRFWGTSVLNANFATNALTGSITGINAYSVSGGGSAGTTQTSLGSVNNINLTGTISGSSFTGTTSASSTAGTAFNIAGATGSLSGGFYGPTAQEAAGVFNLSTTTSGTLTTTVLGSFGAKQQSSQFVASATLGGTQTAITATLNTALFGNIQPVNASTLTSSVPDGFIATGTIATPGGVVTVQAGGSKAITTTGTAAGQAGHVVAGDFSILASTDPRITTAGSGSFESFAASVGLSYAGFGDWSLNPSSNGLPTYVGVTAGAQAGQLQTSAMPTTGSATYTGGAVGYVLQTPGTGGANNAAQFWGTSSLTASFSSGGGSITGGITGITLWSVANGGNGQSRITGTMNNIGLSATISGSSFSGTTSATGTAGTAFNLTSATGSLTGAFYGPAANELAGVFSLANTNVKLFGSFGAKAGTAPSDSRLKQDITPAGSLPNGLKLYSWRYLGGQHRFTGVMAQDLLTDARFAGAVRRDSDGLMRVDYAQLGYAPADFDTMVAEGEQALAAYRATCHAALID